MWNKIIHWIIMPCKEASYEMEKKNAKKISLIQNFRLYLHIRCCKWCSSYHKKLKIMDDLLSEKRTKENLMNVDELKEKIKSKMDCLKDK